MWEIAIKKGAWISFDEEFLNTLKEAGFTEFPAQIQGAAKFEQIVNDNALHPIVAAQRGRR